MNDRLNEATADLGRAILRLRLEGDEDLIARYSEIRSLWWEYADLLVAKDDPRRFGKIAETLEKLNPIVDVILRQTRKTLDDLSKPV